ncbi:MAG: M1 family metallopeptidase, partial [Bacteroidetes bacterium]|nr:M1 family metallopeptidase [Bacteroidota bacterium]
MKKIVLFGFFLTSYFSSVAQLSDDFNFNHFCSQAKRKEFMTKSTDNIVQSSLIHNYDVSFYFLDLNVENNTVELSGNVTISAYVTADILDTIAFELVDELEIDSIQINGDISGYFRNNDEVFVPVSNPLPENEKFNFQIYYHGIPPTGGFFSGISTEYDSAWQKNVTWTLSEPFNARQWWPTKQVLTDKADSSWVFITTSAENKAGSNGILTNMISLPDNKIRYEWKSSYPIDYYLISFAVADYQDYSIYAFPEELTGDSILIQNYIYDSPECLSYYKQSLDETKEMLDLFSDLYGLYPFHQEKYGHCLAGLSGGMEHQTMTTLGYIQFEIVAHELAHSWFGNNVTCSNWSDIWINEGFATYSDFLALEMIAGDPWPEVWKNNIHNFVMSEPGGSVYVPEEEITYENVERIFDSRLSYYKGALMLHMIRFELQNDDLFFQVMKNFQIAFADSTASATDFLNVLNQTSGQDFTWFFQQWYYGEGYPIYSVFWKQNDGQVEISSVQTTSKPQFTPLYRMHIPCKLFFHDGTDTTLILFQQSNHDVFSYPTDKTVDSLQLDPEKWVLKKVESIIGIDETLVKNKISVFPNPVSGYLYLETSMIYPLDAAIFDLQGKTP